MSDKLLESLSALMDNEADDLELRRVLKAMESDHDLSGTWSRYHTVRDALHKQLSHVPNNKTVDLTTRVREALADEKALTQNKFYSFMSVLPRTAAVAALVMLSVIFTAKILVNNELSTSHSNNVVMVDPQFNPALIQRADYTIGQSTQSSQALRAQQRLQRYVMQHTEQAAMQSERSMLPAVRINALPADQQK